MQKRQLHIHEMPASPISIEGISGLCPATRLLAFATVSVKCGNEQKTKPMVRSVTVNTCGIGIVPDPNGELHRGFPVCNEAANGTL